MATPVLEGKQEGQEKSQPDDAKELALSKALLLFKFSFFKSYSEVEPVNMFVFRLLL